MNRRFEFAAAVGISVALNVGAGIVIGVILDWAARNPAKGTFMAGDSSVLVTLESPLAQEPAIAAPSAVQPVAAEPPPPAPRESPPLKPVPRPPLREPAFSMPSPPVAEAVPPPVPIPPSTPPELPQVKPAPLSPLSAPAVSSSAPPATDVVPPAGLAQVQASSPESVTAALPASRPSVSLSPVGSERVPSADGSRRDDGVQGPESFETDLRPVYPMGARLHGEEGVVRVVVELSRTGRAKNVSVEKSSGFASLDKAAQAAIGKARFKVKSGVIRDGMRVRLSIRFTLTNEDRRT